MKSCILLATFLALAYCVSTVHSQITSHYCNETRSRTESYCEYHSCVYRQSCTTCKQILGRKKCTTSYSCVGQWYTKYRTVYYQVPKCCTNWRGSVCNIPICDPACGDRGVCLSPTEKCYCQSGYSGNTCATKTCSIQTDCWPGTCKGNAQCYCSPGFEGNNCQQIRDGPIFTQCNTKLIVDNDRTEQTVFDEVCGKPGYANYTFYTNNKDFNVISMTWDTVFKLPEDTPHKPPYVNRAVPGIVDVSGQLQLYSPESTLPKWQRPVVCNHPFHPTNPFLNVECRNVREMFIEPVKHLYRLEVTLKGKSGGFKELYNSGTTTKFNLTYTGTEVQHQLHIYFDLEPPVHCYKDNSCGDDEFMYPIYVSEDITKNEVDVVVSGWNDTDTGLDIFMYEVYAMQLNQNNKLQELDEPVATGDWDQEGDNIKPPRFKPEQPGMYSVILTVSDLAGNRMRARTLLLYDPVNNMTTDDSKPLHVVNAHEEANYGWIHSTDDDLKVTWNGHFQNKFHDENNLLAAVQKFDTPYDDTHGNRTIEAIPHIHGVVAFRMALKKNSNELDVMPVEEDWENMSLLVETSLPVGRKDGDVIRIWLQAQDAMENLMVANTTVGVDTTEPLYVLQNSKLVKNVETKRPRPHFASRVELNLVDTHSGIHEISFEVHEVVNDNTTNIISTGTEPGQKVNQSPQQCAASGQCVCTTNGECYARLQSVYLNNCWFMEKEDKTFKLRFKAYNQARLFVSDEFPLDSLSGIRGQGEYPPVPPDSLRVSPDTLTGNTATIEWAHPTACYEVKNSIVSYKHGNTEKEHTVSAKSIELTELNANTEYQLFVVLVYKDGRKSPPQELTFSTGEEILGFGAQNGPPIGAITGGVIGMLIVVLLVVLILVMLLRRRGGRPMIPEAVSNATKRISMWHSGEGNGEDVMAARPPAAPTHAPVTQTIGNLAYRNSKLVEDEDDLYIYGGMDTDENARWKFSSDRIEFGKNVPNAKGRFADFRFATIITKSGQETVVAKMLKASASEDDKLLMKAKMNFFGTALSFHPNVVNFIGALPDDQVLLFEYCDKGRLSDWLASIPKVTEDIENDFNNFAIMIANGMVFLHSKHIIHRRLGVRNILLKTDKYGNMVTKIAGFGPMEGEENAKDATLKDKVPIKYLAQEQMKKPAKGVRQYTKETDVWTFGITIWELYSKGGTPYPGMRSTEVPEKVANGYRLPKPEYCPDFVYDEVITECWYAKPTARPTMDGVYQSLKHHLDGGAAGGGGELYYDEQEIADMEEEFYDDCLTTKAMENPAYNR